MPTVDNWRALREALDAGPAEGKWDVNSDALWDYLDQASPAAIRSLLDERDRLATDAQNCKELIWALARELKCLPSTFSDANGHVLKAAIALNAERDRLAAEVEALKDAARINLENYEFQRNKADAATATVYQFHYAMKDAGWHPGRTDDNLCDILRAKGQELAGAAAEVEALRADARRYRWLRDVSVPPHNFYVAVPVEFEGVKYTPAEVDAGIDAAMKGKP